LWSDGAPVNFSSRKAQALLAYLAVNHQRAQSRESLASLLWARTGEERARHNLRQALSKIRQCSDSLLVSSGDCLKLDTAIYESDVARFEELVDSDDTASMRECIDLYEGELLLGLNPRESEYSEWLQMTRIRIRNQACQVAAELGQALFEQGRMGESITAFRDLLAIDPAHEPAHRQLMIMLDRTGNRSDAIRQYQECTEALERELGVEPGVETRQLYAELLGPDSATISDIRYKENTPSLSSGASPPAVAVMPFENLSDSGEAYFADGIAEDLITALSCFNSLVVIARGSSFVFRNSELTDQNIAGELGAQYLVRGSVQRSADRVRINVQLLDADQGVHVWGHRYDREMENVFVLQDEITSTLVSTLAGRVEAARLARARKAPPERLDAHDLLLRGRDHHHRFTAEDCKICIDMFERAIDQDPAYAVAHAWLACGLGQAMVFELDDLPTLVDRCEISAERGLALDENDSECHRVLAQVSMDRGNLKRALQHQQRALFLNPNDDRTVNAMGEMLIFAGQAEEAEQWVRKSMYLNPYHPPRYLTHLMRALFHQGRFEEALEVFDRIDRARKDDFAYCIAAMKQSGDEEGALRVAAMSRQKFIGFDPVEFANSLPFENEEDRQILLKPLLTLKNN
jgi:pentatricopeptide repeat protein